MKFGLKKASDELTARLTEKQSGGKCVPGV